MLVTLQWRKRYKNEEDLLQRTLEVTPEYSYCSPGTKYMYTDCWLTLGRFFFIGLGVGGTWLVD